MGASPKELPSTTPQVAEPTRAEVRDYIVEMAAQLSTFAERHQLSQLAKSLREVVVNIDMEAGDERD